MKTTNSKSPYWHPFDLLPLSSRTHLPHLTQFPPSPADEATTPGSCPPRVPTTCTLRITILSPHKSGPLRIHRYQPTRGLRDPAWVQPYPVCGLLEHWHCHCGRQRRVGASFRDWESGSQWLRSSSGHHFFVSALTIAFESPTMDRGMYY